MVAELAGLPGVLAVALGGSRARDLHRPDSDWDFALYYRGRFDPGTVRAKGWEGQVFDIGAWGGGVMNGGAWLTVDGRRVDVMYRDLDDVEHWTAEAAAGRFVKQQLLFYTAGIPTYVLAAELACNRVLRGTLPVPAYPEPLSVEATRRWHDDAMASLDYGLRALRQREDVAVVLANALRALFEEGNSRMAAARRWVLNEKGLLEDAGLLDELDLLRGAGSSAALDRAVGEIAARIGAR